MAIDIGKAFKLGSEGITTKKGFSSIGELVSSLIKNVYIIAGVICLFLLIFGGIGFILQAGSENPEAAAKSKGAITAAVLGFLIIFTSYWIIQIIEYILGINILNPSGV